MLTSRRLLLWVLLLAGALVIAALLRPVMGSAGLMVGAMVVAMAFGFTGKSMQVKHAAFAFSQAITAIAIAATLDTHGFYETAARGWMFVAVLFTIACGTAVGWALVHLRKLPGTTAAWGCLPGAASIMGSLAAESGGNGIMVSVMHYLRIVLVVATCPVIAGALAANSPAAATANHMMAGATHAHSAFAALVGVLLAGSGCWIGNRYRVPGGSFFIPLAMGAAWMASFPMGLHVPKLMLGAAFMILGAAIGLQFRREHARPMLRSMPIMLAAVVTIVFLCAASAWLLTLISPTNLLTAYLATSPGGLDTIAAIAIGADVDMNFVVAVQTVRFFMIVLAGPWLARAMSRRFGDP